MVSAYEPCSPWAAVEGFSVCEPGDVRPEVMADALAVATTILFVKTGRVFPGVCVDTWRPSGCWSCSCSTWAGCSCPWYPWLDLRSAPVTSVTSVTVDGVALAASAWKLGDPDDPLQAGRLYRLDGGTWPCCQDIALEATEPGTWQIVYPWGEAPPAGGDLMAEILACEYVKLWTGGKCRLPAHLTTITRENLTSTVVADPQKIIADGQVGLPEVDLWVASINPSGADRQPKILNPDLMGMAHDPTVRYRGEGHRSHSW